MIDHCKITLFRLTICVLSIVLFSGFTPGESYSKQLSNVRNGFYEAVQNSQKVDQLFNQIEKVKPQSSLIKVYKGATYAIKAKNKWNPWSAIKLLKKSKKKMNEAVKIAPKNLEIRFIRFAVQKNIPNYLGFSDNIEEDKKYIIKNINRFYNPQLSKEMRDYVLWFMTEQGGYNKRQIKLIKETLKD